MNYLKEIVKKINLATLLIAVLTFVLGWQVGQKQIDIKWQTYRPTINVVNKEPPQNINLDFKLFWDTWDLVSRQYLDKKAIDQSKMFYGAIQGMVAAVGDPYTVFLPPEQQKSSKGDLNGSFEGVGIQLGFNKDSRLVVVAPLSGTPAEKAGIKPEDVIVKIEDKDTTNMTLPDAVKLIRGPKGTSVNLTMFRIGDKDTKEVSLTRDTIVVKSVEVIFKETESGDEVAIIKLSRFGDRTQTEWTEVVSEVLSKGVKGVILDLRNNPGGYLEGAVYIASEFLDGGVVVMQENSKGEKSSYSVNRQGQLLKLPMIVLINKGSASASEIVAGALQDRKRAKLVGEKSFGKGTIQEAEDLQNGTGIHITIAKWLTPNGRWTNETSGFEPDVEVKIDDDNDVEDDIKDTQLDKALELLN